MLWDSVNNRMGIDCIGYGAAVMATDNKKCDCSQVLKPYPIFWDINYNRCGMDCVNSYSAIVIPSDATKCTLTKNSLTYNISWDETINNNIGIDCS